MNKNINKILIKICGIVDPQIAALTARAGADYIGIVFHPTSSRYVSLAQAQEIASAARENGAKPVAVFTQHNGDAMKNICEANQINVVQLHGARSRAEHNSLPAHIERIYARQINKNGSIVNALSQGLKHCDVTRDILLFDNINPGSGETINWRLFKYKGDLPLGIAGGLSRENIASILPLVRPRLVDVSSGVEDASGMKNITLIEEFIQEVRNIERTLS